MARSLLEGRTVCLGRSHPMIARSSRGACERRCSFTRNEERNTGHGLGHIRRQRDLVSVIRAGLLPLRNGAYGDRTRDLRLANTGFEARLGQSARCYADCVRLKLAIRGHGSGHAFRARSSWTATFRTEVRGRTLSSMSSRRRRFVDAGRIGLQLAIRGLPRPHERGSSGAFR